MRSSHRDNPLLHPLFVPVLLVVAVLIVYYPAIGSGIHTVDDPGLISLFSSPPPLLELLKPGYGGGYYYRPIVELSYYLDSRLWSMEPAVLHLENMLLHMANAFLVYLLGVKVAKHFPVEAPWAPVCAALLFALHPLNVEAVVWISGRTDVLAALFVLASALFFLSWLEEARKRDAFCAAALFALGVLTKETAIASLPVALLFLLNWPTVAARRKHIALGLGTLLLAVLVASALLFSYGGVLSLKRLLAPDHFDLLNWARNSATAFGFYSKKMALPLPLNFAIAEVDPRYGLVGILALAALMTAFFLWRFNTLFFAASALMVLPALLVATKQIAWTPFAERYMYLPTAFCAVGISCLLLSCQRGGRKLLGFFLIVLCIAGIANFRRSMLWQDKLSFYLDAVKKSPGFGSVYNELGGQLFQKRDYDAAEQAFAAADRLNERPSMKMLIKLNVMATLVAKHKQEQASAYFYQLFPGKKEAPADFLELLSTVEGGRLGAATSPEKAAVAADLLQTLALLYQKKPDAFWLYRSGQVAGSVGRTKEAADYFAKAYAVAPADAYYKNAAKISQMKMEAAR